MGEDADHLLLEDGLSPELIDKQIIDIINNVAKHPQNPDDVVGSERGRMNVRNRDNSALVKKEMQKSTALVQFVQAGKQTRTRLKAGYQRRMHLDQGRIGLVADKDNGRADAQSDISILING